jgi:hypothetical protein
LTTPQARLHINGDTGNDTFILISNGTTTGVGAAESFLIGVNNVGWPQLQSRYNNTPILIRFTNGSNFYHIARNFFTIFSSNDGENFNDTSASPATRGDRVVFGTKRFTWNSVSGQQYRVISTFPVPSNSMVTVESIFNTSINSSGTKQFRSQKIISYFTVNTSGTVQVFGTPDILAESSAQSFIGGAQVVNGGSNTLQFEVFTGNGASGFSGRSVVSFTATINNYQGH